MLPAREGLHDEERSKAITNNNLQDTFTVWEQATTLWESRLLRKGQRYFTSVKLLAIRIEPAHTEVIVKEILNHFPCT